MATHSSILAWEIPWTVEPGGLQSMGSQKSQTQRATKKRKQQSIFTYSPLLNAVVRSASAYKRQYWDFPQVLWQPLWHPLWGKHRPSES